MLCKECGTPYVRAPCPNCGFDGSKPTKIEIKEEPEESLRKPSEVLKPPVEEGEPLRRPSEVHRQQDNRTEDSLRRPSEVLGTDVAHNVRTDPSFESNIKSVSERIREREEHFAKKTNEDEMLEYKEKVKDTLQEVVTLLEKLLEN